MIIESHLRVKIVVFLLFPFLIFLYSCDTFSTESETTTDEQASTNETADKDDLVLRSVSYTHREFRSDDCQSNCAEVTVNYPKTGDSGFDSFFEKQITKRIDDFLRDAKGARSIEEFALLYIDSYEEFKSAFPETQTPWYLRIDGEITYQTGDWFSFKIVTDSYSGGAHPNSTTEYKLISSTGREKRIQDVISDMGAFREIAESAFRKANNVSADTPWEDTSFMFENNEFVLPENIGFTSKGAVLYYNSYEAASYAEGPTELLIPFDKIKGQINF
jgi:hypothetical protein